MLKKLFIHEWKDCWRLVAILNLFVVGLTLVGAFGFKSDAWNTSQGITGALLFCYIMFYVISVSSLGLIVSLYFYFRFYKNLYTDQGYLMHTLPVSSHQLIWSKTFVAMIWHFISLCAIVLSVLGLVLAAIEEADRKEIIRELMTLLGQLEFDYRVVILVIEGILFILVSTLASLFMGYASISIGQQFKKQKLLGAIGVYVGIYMVMQIFGSIITFPLTNIAESTGDSGWNWAMGVLFLMFLAYALLAAGFYCIIYNAMRNKLNLE